jgi:hypothetical protein
MKMMKCAVILVLLFPCLARSAPLGAIIESSTYDEGVTSVRIVNTSHKEITALGIAFGIAMPDGSTSDPALNEFYLDFLEGVAQGVGGFAPGATESQEFRGQPGPVKATVDVVVYADGTAEVLNDRAFQFIVATRKARALALQKITALLATALADQNEQHPSRTVAEQLKVLLHASEQQKVTDAGIGAYRMELKNEIRDLENNHQTDSQLRETVKYHSNRQTVMERHSSVKAVQP